MTNPKRKTKRVEWMTTVISANGRPISRMDFNENDFAAYCEELQGLSIKYRAIKRTIIEEVI